MTDSDAATAETQARRLEIVFDHLATLLRRPDVAQRLRAAGPDEWSVVQILGHLGELIPHWMSDARALATASGEPPHFGRTLDAPERLEAVRRGAASEPDELLGALEREIRVAAADIRGMSAAERAKTGIHNRLGKMAVSEMIRVLIVEHAEGHEAQVKQVLELGGSSSPEDNKQVVRRLYEEFTNQRKLDLAAELCAPDFIDHGAPVERSGVEGLKDSVRLFMVAFPDFQFQIEDLLAEGDRVHVRGTISGTHQGPYSGMPATGKHAQWSAMDDFRFENGKIVERWTERNRISLLRQLGVLRG
jgi:steroid delta-isomerase-like uncharacterized protein